MPKFFDNIRTQLSALAAPLTGGACNYELLKTLKALSSHDNEKKRVILNYIYDVSSEDLSSFLGKLENRTDISDLTIRFANLDGKHVEQLIRIIKNNAELRTLDLSANKFNLTDLDALADVILGCKNLTVCELWGNPILTVLGPLTRDEMTPEQQASYNLRAKSLDDSYRKLMRELDQHCAGNLREQFSGSNNSAPLSVEGPTSTLTSCHSANQECITNFRAGA